MIGTVQIFKTNENTYKKTTTKKHVGALMARLATHMNVAKFEIKGVPDSLLSCDTFPN